jgi:hypothetical protein
MRIYLIGNIWYCTQTVPLRGETATNNYEPMSAEQSVNYIKGILRDEYAMFVIGSALDFDPEKAAIAASAIFYGSCVASNFKEDNALTVNAFLLKAKAETEVEVDLDDIEMFVPCNIIPDLDSQWELLVLATVEDAEPLGITDVDSMSERMVDFDSFSYHGNKIIKEDKKFSSDEFKAFIADTIAFFEAGIKDDLDAYDDMLQSIGDDDDMDDDMDDDDKDDDMDGEE